MTTARRKTQLSAPRASGQNWPGHCAVQERWRLSNGLTPFAPAARRAQVVPTSRGFGPTRRGSSDARRRSRRAVSLAARHRGGNGSGRSLSRWRVDGSVGWEENQRPLAAPPSKRPEAAGVGRPGFRRNRSSWKMTGALARSVSSRSRAPEADLRDRGVEDPRSLSPYVFGQEGPSVAKKIKKVGKSRFHAGDRGTFFSSTWAAGSPPPRQNSVPRGSNRCAWGAWPGRLGA